MLSFANRIMDRDVIPFEVIEMISSRTLVVRDMIADLSPEFKPKVVMQQCINNEDQAWDIQPDPTGLSFRIRMNKDGKWKDVNGHYYELAEQPKRWHHFGRL